MSLVISEPTLKALMTLRPLQPPLQNKSLKRKRKQVILAVRIPQFYILKKLRYRTKQNWTLAHCNRIQVTYRRQYRAIGDASLMIIQMA